VECASSGLKPIPKTRMVNSVVVALPLMQDQPLGLRVFLIQEVPPRPRFVHEDSVLRHG
jgi:hypothetical protein